MMNHIIEVCHTLFFQTDQFLCQIPACVVKEEPPKKCHVEPRQTERWSRSSCKSFEIPHSPSICSEIESYLFPIPLYTFQILNVSGFTLFFSNCPSFYIVRADSPSCSMLYTIVGAGDAAQAAAAAAQERNGAAGIDEGIAADGDATGHVRMLHLQPWRLIGLTNHGQNSPKIRDFGNSMINSKIMSININNHEEHFPVAISLMERSTPGYP